MGEERLPGPYGYWWVPIVGPLVGGSLGVALYKFFISDALAAKAAAAAASDRPEVAADPAEG